jgi:hypothetical protein
MPSNEDLYDEMRQEEASVDELASHALKMKRGAPPPPSPPEVNKSEARMKYERDFKPLIERIKRVQAGKPITNNPIKNAWLKITGQDKLPEVEVVDPRAGILVQSGKSAEEIRQEMIDHPEAFADLAQRPPVVKPVGAQRKTVQDLKGER